MHAGQRRHRAGRAEQVEAPPLHQMVEPVAALEVVEHAPRHRRPWPRRSRGVTSRPPKRSASDTTPTGSDVQATMWLASRGERCPLTSISAISDEPPPMSNSTTPSVSRSTSEPQPETASRASVWRSMISSVEPGLRLRPASRNSSPFSAARQASVAISRALLDARGRAACRRRSSAPRRRGPSPPRDSLPLRRQPLAQPHDARKRVDDAELARTAGHGDQQPAIVGAEIERGEDRQVLARRPARLARATDGRRCCRDLDADVGDRRRRRQTCASPRRIGQRRRAQIPCGRACACAAACPSASGAVRLPVPAWPGRCRRPTRAEASAPGAGTMKLPDTPASGAPAPVSRSSTLMSSCAARTRTDAACAIRFSVGDTIAAA